MIKPLSRAFETGPEAKNRARDHERESCEHRDRGDVNTALTQLTLADLIRDDLDDSGTQKLGSHDGYQRLLSWWKARYGDVRVLELGARILRKARSTLQVGRPPLV